MSNELDPIIKLLKLSLTQSEAYCFNNKNDVRGFELKQELLSLVQRYESLSKDRSNKDESKTWYFTFGVGHPNAGYYQIIEGTFISARDRMFQLHGREWCMQYSKLEDFSPEKYNLKALK